MKMRLSAVAQEAVMLRRRNATLFDAPAGAQIQVVASSQGNNGVNDARFEYAGQVLNRETILGLPGCTFTVDDDSRELLEAVVIFDDGANSAARYDLFEVENGVQSPLGKFTLKSDGANQIGFSIQPVAAAVPVGAAPREMTGAPPPKRAPKAAKRRPAPKKRVAKRAGRKGAKKKTARRRGTRKRG
jgi:hypothetical protein